MNVAKKRTLRGDGPGLKRKRKQDGQVKGSATKEDTSVVELQKYLDACKEDVWSGTIEFHEKQKRFLSSCRVRSDEKINTVNWTKQLKMTTISYDDLIRPQSQSNDQRQAMVISGCRLHSRVQINTVNWPKQLNMTTISRDDYRKLDDLHVMRATQWVTFSMDEDCDKMSRRAFIQSTSWPNCGCVLVEYTSCGIRVLSFRSSLEDENVTAGFIHKFTNQDSTVELLTDLGILSHATTANMLAKENARLKEELQRKDKMLIEQQMLHREKVVMLKIRMTGKEARMERERDVMQKQIMEKDRTIYQKESALKEKDEAISERDEALVVKETDLMEKDNTIMTVEQDKDELQQENNELVNEVHTKQAALANIQKEFECGICKEPLNKATIMDCGHSFCDECIQTNRKEDVRCPNCRARLETYKFRPCFIIDSCIEVIKETRRKESVRERKGEPIQGELEVQSQSVSEESGDDPSPVSPSSSGSSASSYCRAPSSIENMFSPASSSDSNQGDVTEGE